MSDDPHGVVGMYIDLTGYPSLSLVTADEQHAPKLTAGLIDDVLAGIDVRGIEEHALQWSGAGEPLDLAGRTLDAVRAALHDRVHAITDATGQSSPADGEPDDGHMPDHSPIG